MGFFYAYWGIADCLLVLGGVVLRLLLRKPQASEES
jgi:hypothetical protein